MPDEETQMHTHLEFLGQAYKALWQAQRDGRVGNREANVAFRVLLPALLYHSSLQIDNLYNHILDLGEALHLHWSTWTSR